MIWVLPQRVGKGEKSSVRVTAELAKTVSAAVAQQKKGILTRLRRENEIFTGNCGKIFMHTFYRVIKERR